MNNLRTTRLGWLLWSLVAACVFGCGSPSQPGNGMDAYNQDDFETARTYFTTITGSSAKAYQARLYEARMLREEGRIEEAVAAFQRLSGPDSPAPQDIQREALIARAGCLFESGDTAGFESALHQLPPREDLSPRLAYLAFQVVAQAYAAKMGSIGEAAREIGEAYRNVPPDEREPAWEAELIMLAAWDERRKDPERARTALRDLGNNTAQKPNVRARAWMQAARLSMRVDDYGEALQCLDEASRLPHLMPPTQVELTQMRTLALIGDGRYKEAAAVLAKAEHLAGLTEQMHITLQMTAVILYLNEGAPEKLRAAALKLKNNPACENLPSEAESAAAIQIETEVPVAVRNGHPPEGIFNYWLLRMCGAVNHDDVEELKALVKLGVPINLDLDDTNRTALHLAAGGNRVEVLKHLIAADLNINLQNGIGDTPLMEAARHGRLEAARMLLEAGADRSVGNRRGQRAYDLVPATAPAELRTLLKTK